MNVARWIIGIICGLTCVSCPFAIAWLGETYAEKGYDYDYDPWPEEVINGLFWLAAVTTVGLIWSLRSWYRWVGAAVAVSLLVLTAFIAVGASIRINYF
jgi:hypothetical protein